MPKELVRRRDGDAAKESIRQKLRIEERPKAQGVGRKALLLEYWSIGHSVNHFEL